MRWPLSYVAHTILVLLDSFLGPGIQASSLLVTIDPHPIKSSSISWRIKITLVSYKCAWARALLFIQITACQSTKMSMSMIETLNYNKIIRCCLCSVVFFQTAPHIRYRYLFIYDTAGIYSRNIVCGRLPPSKLARSRGVYGVPRSRGLYGVPGHLEVLHLGLQEPASDLNA